MKSTDIDLRLVNTFLNSILPCINECTVYVPNYESIRILYNMIFDAKIF